MDSKLVAVARRVLRLAAAHDRQPYLKALLPLSGVGVDVPLDESRAPPLRLLVLHALRSPPDPSSPAALPAVARLLEANLKRRKLYTAKQKAAERASLAEPKASPVSPNVAWFFSRLDAACQRTAGGDEGAARRAAAAAAAQRTALQAAAGQAAPFTPAAAEEPLSILQQMLELQMVPPRRLVVHSLKCLALSGAPGDYEQALRVLWLADLHTPHLLCGECVDALVAGALAEGHTWRALSVAEAMHLSAGLLGSSHIVNKVLTQAATMAADLAQLERARLACRRFAQAGVPVLEDAGVALLNSAQRLACLPTALAACRGIRQRGGVLGLPLLHYMHLWAVTEGDVDGAAFLEEWAAASEARGKPKMEAKAATEGTAAEAPPQDS